MKPVKVLVLAFAALGLIAAGAWFFVLKDQVAFARIAAAYGAKMVCSCRFVAARPMESCLTDFTTDLSAFKFEETGNTVRASAFAGFVYAEARNTGPDSGCTLVEP